MSNDHFVTTLKTNNAGISSPTSITIQTSNVTHDFGSAGTYTTRIKGVFPRFYFNNEGDKAKIISLDQWGTGRWTRMAEAFFGTFNLTVPATDTQDLSIVTSLANMFRRVTLATQTPLNGILRILLQCLGYSSRQSKQRQQPTIGTPAPFPISRTYSTLQIHSITAWSRLSLQSRL